MLNIILIAYVALCAVNGYLGRRARIGFLGFFILSLLLSPLVGLILALLFRPRGEQASSA
ncbi:hypothetical protein C882_0266 [Caenispirillum salinarum AK4]|uniref:Uncharacterized protein n=1 Tax=Caenispirillum salinarum AK4 TaxID=1238182 RepID=K9HMR3_9PROT|nr:hypothetical protein [Caenispirillum salinarum]EKV29836.1 hypothetical protein C882_0266 [Caenispirillum salinarum AK4]